MSPPALVIAGSIVIVVVGTVAFHQVCILAPRDSGACSPSRSLSRFADDQTSIQFIYEPHIAPKLDIIIENWKEQRKLKRRRLAPAVYAGRGDDDEGSSTSSGPSDDKQGLEMKDISIPLRITGIDAGLSESTLRRRRNASGLDEAMLLKSVSTSICPHFCIHA
jgi:hypothetical protein